ncbi:MAX gene-associated protein isoform X2 [Myripristis murdjan]|uniref:MAX gene-associated protein isoform X2 n=1 Tax=Myripristis murdjan TaxID=586833 RepID=UPI001176169D|nr:MAX gene-associated protein-like isoform X2 [Myripristis murdjan]
MEDPHVVPAQEDEEDGCTAAPSHTSPLTVTTGTSFSSENVMENQAVSMASNHYSPTLSSPAEASPAKPAATSPATTKENIEPGQTTSDIASASDSLTCAGTSLVNTSTASVLPSSSLSPCVAFSNPELEKSFPAQLTFRGVSVTLENNSVWKQFHSRGTEMILTKQGRRMFPYCRYRLSGLEPTRQYNLVLSIVPADQYRYRWSSTRWEVSGPAENQTQGLIRAFPHHYSPCLGSEWMSNLVSFYKLKLTNNIYDQEGHLILYSMHRYIPRLHVIPVPDGGGPTPDQPVVKGPESMTFTFPQTEFFAVTTYQNIWITQLKINHNPFAKGFREDGQNHRLQRLKTEPEAAGRADAQPLALKPFGSSSSSEEVVDLSTKNCSSPASPLDEQDAKTKAKQKTAAIMNALLTTSPASNQRTNVDSAERAHPHAEIARGDQARCGHVLLHNPPPVFLTEEKRCVNVTPKVKPYVKIAPKLSPATPASLKSTPALSPGRPKKRRRINRRWGNSRGKEGKAEAASTVTVHSPSLTVAMQPEVDDVEGLVFVSFTSKEALGIHVGDQHASMSSPVTPVSPVSPTPQSQLVQTVTKVPETEEEKIARLQAVLLQDLAVLKHRQVIHPVLQEVGLKLTSLDPIQAIDLQYLGVCLPLPAPVRAGQADATVLSCVDEGLPFISRTGKTSDMTKIKGWRDKFIRSKETSLKCDGPQKDLSAFCSDMLDEYLESEAQIISERAAAFSSGPESSVAYRLPTKSSSYVKTLDSALKHRNSACKVPAAVNRPCPLSHKPLLYSALVSPAPPLTHPASVRAGPMQSAFPPAKPRPAVPNKSPVATLSVKTTSGSKLTLGASPVLHRSEKHQKPGTSCGQSQGMTHHRPTGFSKHQLKLWEMEKGAANQGTHKTQLTPERLAVALSVLLTPQMQPSQRLMVPEYKKPTSPECGQAFCRLGCVCSSLQSPNRGPLHCRRPDCMFGCACFKRKITKQKTQDETEDQIQPHYSVTNMEHEVQPCPGSHSDRLWDRSTTLLDPEPLFTPKPAARLPSPVTPSNKSSVPHIIQQMREEDKDPVYKYLESFMTCARVREFNSKPSPEVTLQSQKLASLIPSTMIRPQKTINNMLKKTRSPAVTVKNAGKAAVNLQSKETETKMQIEIQSACRWDKDRKLVLSDLFKRLRQNHLSPRFNIGPYAIRLVSKIYMRKSNVATITYRVHISKPKKISDDDDDDGDDVESDDCNEEEETDHSSDENQELVEDDSPAEEPEVQVGVTPFLSGVLPAGRLRARKRPSGRQAMGLIQVNGKSYTQARLLLGSMGSLHPANRLAAHVTGRLQAAPKAPLKNSKSKIHTPGNRRCKTAGTMLPPVGTALKATAQKRINKPSGQQVNPDILKKEPGTSPHPSQKPSAMSTFMTFVTGQRGSLTSLQSSSSLSPVSLTVSPSLKTPSFLGHSGTYSFRICPPATPGSRGSGQHLPGVTLPGGFTLIELPKPNVDGAVVQLAENVNTTNMTGTAKPPPQKDVSLTLRHLAASSNVGRLILASNRTHSGTTDLSRDRSVERDSSPELMCDEKMPSDESDTANKCKLMTRAESDLDTGSEDVFSDFSDCAGDRDEEPVDIETVDENKLTISEIMPAASRSLLESQCSSEDSGSARESRVKPQSDSGVSGSHTSKRRTNHRVLERLRRSEQRYLFNRLQHVLRSDPRAPKLRLLSLALNEIRTLVETSKCLEEEKRRLAQMQSVYIKELSLLSGKPAQLIKIKLKEIYKRKKLRESGNGMVPFSPCQRQQPKAPEPQTTAHNTESQPTPLPQPEVPVPHSPTPAQVTAQEPRLKLQSQPQNVLTPATAKVIALPSQEEDQLQAPAASVQVTEDQSTAEDRHEALETPPQVTASHSQMEDQASSAPATLQVTETQDGLQTPLSPTQVLSPQSDAHPQSSVCPLTLPLIRSKTGRIILPSCLKPLGQGFYTITLMGANQKGKNSDVSSSPQMLSSDLDSSKEQERISFESEQPSDISQKAKNPGNSHTVEKVKKSSPLGHKTAKRRGLKRPSVELSRLNKSIILPTVALQPLETNLQGDRMLGLNRNMTTACLSFNPLSPSTAPEPAPETEPEPSSSVVRRRRGRPRKHPVTPDQPGKNPVEETNDPVEESSSLVEETKTQAEDNPVNVPQVQDTPVPVKRGRGRPVRKKRGNLSSTTAGTACGKNNTVLVSSSPVMQVGSSSATASQPLQSPVRLTRSIKALILNPRAALPQTSTSKISAHHGL